MSTPYNFKSSDNTSQELAPTVRKNTKQFLTDCRFLRSFIGKKIPRGAIIKHARATADVGLFIGMNYIVDNNPTIDTDRIVGELDYRMEYLGKIVVHRQIFEDLAQRSIRIDVYPDGSAKIVYPNGDTLVSRYSAQCPVNPLTYVNDVVAVEFAAKAAVENVEITLRDNLMPYDKARGDVAIKLVTLARLVGQGIILPDNHHITAAIMDHGLNCNSSEFVNLFANRPFVLSDYMVMTINDFNERHCDGAIIESPKSSVPGNTVDEQTGAIKEISELDALPEDY